jgi:hypothetical protein
MTQPKSLARAEDFYIDARVVYVPAHANGDLTHSDCEHGIVKRQTGETVFVRYYRNGVLQDTAQATSPTDLRLLDGYGRLIGE